MNLLYFRQLHRILAPILLLPLLITLMTGSLFQIAVITGKANEFAWLLDLHRGKFGRINLEIIYPFFNAIGLLLLLITGIIIWLRYPPTRRYR
jgi:hypothetical protein